MNTTKMNVKEATNLVVSCFTKYGCTQSIAESVAKVIVAAEIDGCLSHGLFRVPGYVSSIKSGKVNCQAEPELRSVASGGMIVDGQGGFAPPALDAGRAALIEATKSKGIAALGLVNIHHFSALWTDLESICQEDLVAFGFTGYLPFVAPAGGSKPLFGTNPMAFGWPRKSLAR